MGRGNDAIPSWSGFNYQGKMALLCVLEMINSIADKSVLADYWVELEKTEDFVIGRSHAILALYQVKAVLSHADLNYYIQDRKNSNGTLRPSIAKELMIHRTETHYPTAKCYLVSAVEIRDWDTGINPYKSEVHHVNITITAQKA